MPKRESKRKANKSGDPVGPPDPPLGEVIERAQTASPELAELAAEDTDSGDVQQRLRDEKARRPETFYSDLIYALSGLRYPENEARILWGDLLNHKVEMSNKLGRNVGIQVASLDFFKNIVGSLDRVHFVDPEQFFQTARLAITDGLTGLYNHRYFQERLRQALRKIEEAKLPLSLLMIDIDYFKVYNDLNGHIAGDVALREVAQIIRRVACEAVDAPNADNCEIEEPKGPAGTVSEQAAAGTEACPVCGLPLRAEYHHVTCRYGGEEFSVILAGVSKEDASVIAERVRRDVEAADFPNEDLLPDGRLSISIGVAEFPQDAHEPSGLIQHADRALYVAKRSGRNRVCAVVGDRRLFERIGYDTAAGWEPVGGGERKEFRCADLSLGGMGIRGEILPEPGAIVRIYLQGAEDDPLIGRCIWREERDCVFSGGVRFVALDRRQEKLIKDIVGI